MVWSSLTSLVVVLCMKSFLMSAIRICNLATAAEALRRLWDSGNRVPFGIAPAMPVCFFAASNLRLTRRCLIFNEFDVGKPLDYAKFFQYAPLVF